MPFKWQFIASFTCNYKKLVECPISLRKRDLATFLGRWCALCYYIMIITITIADDITGTITQPSSHLNGRYFPFSR